MVEHNVISSIKYHLLYHHLQGEIWHIDRLVAYMSAIVFPIYENISYNSNQGTVKPLCECLSKYFNCAPDNKFLLSKLSFDGLVDFFSQEFFSKIETSIKISYIKDALTDKIIVYIISEDGFVSLTHKDVYLKVVDLYSKFVFLGNYGDRCYVSGEIDVKSTGDFLTLPKSGRKNNKVRLSERSSTEYSGIKRSLLSLYDEFVQVRGGYEIVSELKYIWQWRLSTSEYNKLKKKLAEDDLCKKYIKNLCKESLKINLLLVAYIAERYKREWNGHDGNENSLKRVGLGDSDSLAIAERYFGTNSGRVYNYKTNQRYIHEWLDTLNLEGGLPINYIVKSSEDGANSGNNLLDFTRKICENPVEAINILTEKTSNQSIRHSYVEGYSLKMYIGSLLEKGLKSVCSEEDIKDPVFNKFKILLETGKDEAKRTSKKFSYKFKVWKFKDEFILRQSIVLKEDSVLYGESQDLISRERIMQMWGVQKLEKNDVFWLEIGGKKYEFHSWGEDYYRSVDGRVEFPISTSQAPGCAIAKIPIYYIGQYGERLQIQIVHDNDKGFIKFISSDGYDWRTNGKGDFSAVLMTKRISYELENQEQGREIQIGTSLRWIEFEDRIQIKGKYLYSGKLELCPCEEAIHPLLKHKFISRIKYYKDQDFFGTYLLDASKIKRENFILVGNDGSEGVRLKSCKGSNSCGVKYKTIKTNSWSEIHSDSKLTGFTKLKIDDKILDVYILPGDADIDRELYNNEIGGKIMFFNFGNTRIEVKGYELKFIERGCYIEDSYSEKNSSLDSLSVNIYSLEDDLEDEWVSMDIVRPLNRRDKILGRNVLNWRIDVPKKLEREYKLRIFDADGVRYTASRSSSKKYSSKRIMLHPKKGFYYVANGVVTPQLEANVEFVFISCSGVEQPLTISEIIAKDQGKDIRYLSLANLPQKEPGVIIQSLKRKVPELTYYEPKWIRDSYKSTFIRGNPLQKLELAFKHGQYFEDFIDKNEITDELLVGFFFNYYNACKRDGCLPDWNRLWEMSIELEREWVCIPRAYWCKDIDDDKKKIVCELFRSRIDTNSSIYDEFIDNYWNLKWREYKKSRGNITAALKYFKSILDSYGSKETPVGFPELDEKFQEEYTRLLI